MPFLFRTVRKPRWTWEPGQPPWLPPDETPAAPFADVSPSAESILSVWRIDDDESNLHRVVAALASGREHPDKIDCALIDEPDLLRLGIRVEAAPDPCADQEASDRWHRNLVHLTGSKLASLVLLIRDQGRVGRIRRFQEPLVVSLLQEGLDANRIDSSKVKYRTLLEALARARGASGAA